MPKGNPAGYLPHPGEKMMGKKMDPKMKAKMAKKMKGKPNPFAAAMKK